MSNTEIGGLALLKKPKQKLTLIVPGGGMMGCALTSLSSLQQWQEVKS